MTTETPCPNAALMKVCRCCATCIERADGAVEIPPAVATKSPDPSKAYNAFRLEEKFGGVWSRFAVDAKGFQDHYMTLPDGSVWRPRKPLQYYTTAVGKLMMVRSTFEPLAQVE